MISGRLLSHIRFVKPGNYQKSWSLFCSYSSLDRLLTWTFVNLSKVRCWSSLSFAGSKLALLLGKKGKLCIYSFHWWMVILTMIFFTFDINVLQHSLKLAFVVNSLHSSFSPHTCTAKGHSSAFYVFKLCFFSAYGDISPWVNRRLRT